jgi:hypothetical protein
VTRPQRRDSIQALVPGRLTAAGRDVSALGLAVPLRAAYELSKKTGLHGLVFGQLVRHYRPTPAGIEPSPVAVPPASAARSLAASKDVMAGKVVVFGRTIEIGTEPAWNALIEQPGAWPDEPWWEIDLRSEVRRADVKWAWELARQRHVIVLARAAALAPDRVELRDALAVQLRSFLEQAPLETGVHWYSNLEISIRVLAWREILSLVELPEDLRARLTGTMRHAARHLLADLPYTVSTMRNNHLLGDALGLMAAGPPGAAGAAARCGDRIFDIQLRRHMRPDGSMIEDSVSYHRFVLEMLVQRHLLGDGGGGAAVGRALVGAAQFLCRLGALDGPVPEYGDWDEGRLLTSTQDPHDLAGTVRLALALGGTGAPADWRDRHDECAWYAGEGLPVEANPAVVDGGEVGGGVARATAGPFVAWLKAGSGPSHGHADLCSTPILAGGSWLVGDPGTGTYNGAIEQRNYFRSSVAHSVLRLGGIDQLEPHRVFRWRHRAHGAVGEPVRSGSSVVMWGVHDAYRRLQPGRRVARVVLVSPDGVVVSDWVEGPPGIDFALSLPIGPDADFDTVDGILAAGTGRYRLTLPGTVRTAHGSSAPFDGWWSPTYGSVVPSTRIEALGRVAGPVTWAVVRPEATDPSTAPDGVEFGGVRWRVAWVGDGAYLDVDDGAVHFRSLELRR